MNQKTPNFISTNDSSRCQHRTATGRSGFAPAARWRFWAQEMVEKFQAEPERVLAFFASPARGRHRRRTTHLGEGWFGHLRRYLSRFPGCRDAADSEPVLGCFLLAAEQIHA